MSQITITVDNQKYRVENKQLLIDALIDNAIEIPYFCYHKALGADGNCRMCMVEIEGQKRPQIACDTFVYEGMIVRIKGEKINQTRREILELELINHPVDCPICDQAGECKLQDFYMDDGLYESHIAKRDKVKHAKHLDIGSNVILDQERCVLCARCTRFTANVTQTHELGIIHRGDHACVSTMPNRKLDNPYAMNVVDLCPVGALTSKDFRFNQRVWFLDSTPSVCHGCATGCNIFIDHNRPKYQEDTIYRFRPRFNAQINGYFICDYGRLSYKALHEKRLHTPLWDSDAMDEESAKAKLHSMIEAAQTILILVDANLYLEDMVAIAHFAKRLNATLVAPIANYYDESFGDSWLKSPYRCANHEGVKQLGFATELEQPKRFDLMINFNHPKSDAFEATQSIAFATHTTLKANLLLPIPTYAQSSGTLINKEGIKQYCHQAIATKSKTISDWITP